MDEKQIIPDSEDVARILSKEWVVNGRLSNAAFTLKPGETYISVNRPAVDSYDSDVSAFIRKHPFFPLDEGMTCYKRALLHVGDVRNIRAESEEIPLKIDVEIEPRDIFTKSHAGIFTRYGNRNLKNGEVFSAMDKDFSADDVLLEVRTQLMRQATIEEQPIVYNSKKCRE